MVASLFLGWVTPGWTADLLEVRVRDSSTGEAVAATVDVYEGLRLGAAFGFGPGSVISQRAQADGRLSLHLVPKSYLFGVSHPGYRTLLSWFTVGGRETEEFIFWLDRVQPPGYLLPARVQSQLGPGLGLLHGHLVDTVTGKPLDSVRVRLADGSGETLSDERGYFSIFYTVPWTSADMLPATTDLEVEAPEYMLLRVRGVFLLQGDTHFLLQLEPGEGVVEQGPGHRFLLPPAEQPSTPIDQQIPAEPQSATAVSVLEPPASIRVGYANSGCSSTCCSGSCPYTCVFSLENYARRGLNDEWISSWGPQSLRSGAVPYRSYAAWHADHPYSGSYDICSSSCCQVNDADTSVTSDSAVEITAGIMLTADGTPFRSEYSAQNNSWDDPNDGLNCSNTDLSCGNGYVGSPATGWPCLNDLVASGRGCFGHGRGMSQWGTFYWEDQYQKSWLWIAEHYYNADGNPSGLRSSFLTSPIEIQSVNPVPSSIRSGDRFRIDAEVTNHAATAHSHGLLGASLYSPSTGYISDPPNDAAVELVAGTGTVFRYFDIPTETPAGVYDLLVAVWLDIDQDGLVESEDLRLDLITLVGRMEVLSVDSIFADGFETGDSSRWADSPP